MWNVCCVRVKIYESGLEKFITADYFIRVLIVLRAGKGPMVNVTLNAANEAGILVKIYAVDDHPEAFMS